MRGDSPLRCSPWGKHQSPSLASDAVPTGAMLLWGTATPPAGYLSCDGSAVSRSTYAALFAIIGTTFGTGDGSTTFTLPDFRGRAPIGVGTGSGLTARALAATTGAETVTLTGAQSGLPAHDHIVPILDFGGSLVSPNLSLSADSSYADYGWHTSTVSAADAASSHTNMQPSLAVYFVIKT